MTLFKDLPVLPYGGDGDPNSGFAAGVATSEERARRDDADGTTADRQMRALAYVEAHKSFGVIWKELADAYGWHHGQASGALSTLHKEERIARLTERRDRCYVYVVPEHVNGRETQPQGRTGLTQRDRDLVEAREVIAKIRALHTPDGTGWCPECQADTRRCRTMDLLGR